MVTYDELLEELNNESYIGRDKYPITTSGSYELMVHRSGQFQWNGYHSNSGGGRCWGGGGHSGGRLNVINFLKQQHNGEKGSRNFVSVQDGKEINAQCYRCQK